MVTPDYSRYEQDRKPGYVRELHKTLAARDLVYRNQPKADFDKLVQHARMIAVPCDDGYVMGLPYGRHLRVYYEFDSIPATQLHLTSLLTELGGLAAEHSECELMVLDFNDFPHRHRVDPLMVGADFEEPVEVALARLRDMRDVQIPDMPAGITVREATVKDADAIVALDERLSGEGAIGPPLPDEFLKDARWVGVAEQDGALVGYLHLIDAEKRGLQSEEFVVDDERDRDAVTTALLIGACKFGAENDLRALTLRVAPVALGDPVMRTFGFRHADDALLYQRPSDPKEVKRRHEEKVQTYFKIGKIWGRY